MAEDLKSFQRGEHPRTTSLLLYHDLAAEELLVLRKGYCTYMCDKSEREREREREERESVKRDKA